MALTPLAGFLVSDPVVPVSQDYGVVALSGAKVGDLIVSVPVASAPSGHSSFPGNVVSAFLGTVVTDDEVYQCASIDANYTPEIVFILLRGCGSTE